jgi:hypothetical protein
VHASCTRGNGDAAKHNGGLEQTQQNCGMWSVVQRRGAALLGSSIRESTRPGTLASVHSRSTMPPITTSNADFGLHFP